MSTLKLKWLRAGISLFALCMIGTVSAKANTHEGDKKEKEVKTENEKEVQSTQWFTYNGPDQTRNSIENPENYQLLPDAPPCEEGTELCAVHAPNDSGEPVLDPAFVDEIMNSLSSSTPTSSIKLEN